MDKGGTMKYICRICGELVNYPGNHSCKRVKQEVKVQQILKSEKPQEVDERAKALEARAKALEAARAKLRK